MKHIVLNIFTVSKLAMCKQFQLVYFIVMKIEILEAAINRNQPSAIEKIFFHTVRVLNKMFLN